MRTHEQESSILSHVQWHHPCFLDILNATANDPPTNFSMLRNIGPIIEQISDHYASHDDLVAHQQILDEMNQKPDSEWEAGDHRRLQVEQQLVAIFAKAIIDTNLALPACIQSNDPDHQLPRR